MMEAPTGLTWFGPDLGSGAATAAAALYNVVYTGTHEHGGHFAPVEQPAAVIADIRATFRDLRA
jgi:pimeloyl-ACP methyl ester carboxylesterase